MKALITGAAGFIGSTLAQKLVADGLDVTGVDSLTDYYDPRVKRSNVSTLDPRRFTLIEQDLNSGELGDLVESADVVFHLAGQPGVRLSWGAAFDEYIASNIHATQRLLEACRRTASPPRIVFASSSSVYGDAETYPTGEWTTPRPRSPYGVTKLAAEHLCSLYAANYGLPTVSLRFFTVYGPRQRPDMAFTRFLTAAHTGQPIRVFGSGDQVRDFTYVGDIVEALLCASRADIAPGRVFNVSGGGSHSVNEVLEIIERLAAVSLTVEREPVALGDVSRTTADNSAAQRSLGWAPAVPLEAGLQSQLEWVRSTLIPV